MRRLIVASAVALLSSVALAQQPATTTTPPASTTGNTPAVATPETKNPTAPVAGKNSFTEAQAKERIEAAGYTAVTGLMLDANGVWRAKATKGSMASDVGLDYQGNIVTN